ncbi:MAG: hypothetical protein ACYSX0_06490 [Planctomycetota bacterium]|jgi:hypothetical protein
MPADNRFRHQEYRLDAPRGELHLLKAVTGPALDSEDGRARMRAVGEAYRAARVSMVYLIHGTFVGSDALGLLGELSQMAPDLGERLRSWQKRGVDRLTGESANYTEEYARAFEESAGIPVRLFHWSSENDHLGRSDAAVRLIEELTQAEVPRGDRVLLWSHSHGGNVLALVSNLLGGDPRSRGRFFRAARPYYLRPLLRKAARPAWPRVRRLLNRDELTHLTLDMVTFGTPVRYGWETRGYGKLMHFVNHRPFPGLPEHQARFPPDLKEVREGAGGDHVQQIGIAGTDFPKATLNWRFRRAERRLRELLQPGIRNRDLLARLRAGVRVPDEGTTLLVDYEDAGDSIREHVGGHALYTFSRWLPFHAEQVARRLYSAGS